MDVSLCKKTELNFRLLVRRGFDQALRNCRRPEKVQFREDLTAFSKFSLHQRRRTKGKTQAPKVRPVKSPKEGTLANDQNSRTNATDIMLASQYVWPHIRIVTCTYSDSLQTSGKTDHTYW